MAKGVVLSEQDATSEPIDLDDMEFDFSYVYVEYELAALDDVRAVIEPTIARLAQENEDAALDKLRASGWIDDEAEWQFAHQNIAEMRDYILPRLLRGPLVVALWAAYESAVKQVAWRRADAIGLASPFDSRGSEFPKRARKHFSSELKLTLEPDRARYDRLVDLYRVRNALAHANGLKDGMSDIEWQQLREVGRRRKAPVDEWHDMLVLPAAFVQQAYDDVTGSVKGLLARERAARSPHDTPVV